MQELKNQQRELEGKVGGAQIKLNDKKDIQVAAQASFDSATSGLQQAEAAATVVPVSDVAKADKPVAVTGKTLVEMANNMISQLPSTEAEILMRKLIFLRYIGN